MGERNLMVFGHSGYLECGVAVTARGDRENTYWWLPVVMVGGGEGGGGGKRARWR